MKITQEKGKNMICKILSRFILKNNLCYISTNYKELIILNLNKEDFFNKNENLLIKESDKIIMWDSSVSNSDYLFNKCNKTTCKDEIECYFSQVIYLQNPKWIFLINFNKNYIELTNELEQNIKNEYLNLEKNNSFFKISFCSHYKIPIEFLNNIEINLDFQIIVENNVNYGKTLDEIIKNNSFSDIENISNNFNFKYSIKFNKRRPKYEDCINFLNIFRKFFSILIKCDFSIENVSFHNENGKLFLINENKLFLSFEKKYDSMNQNNFILNIPKDIKFFNFLLTLLLKYLNNKKIDKNLENAYQMSILNLPTNLLINIHYDNHIKKYLLDFEAYKKLKKFSEHFFIIPPWFIWQKYLTQLNNSSINKEYLIFDFYQKNLYAWRCQLIHNDIYQFKFSEYEKKLNKNIRNYKFLIKNFQELNQEAYSFIKLAIFLDFYTHNILEFDRVYPFFRINFTPWKI